VSSVHVDLFLGGSLYEKFNFNFDDWRYEPWIDQFSDQSNYKLMLGTRKPVEDLRAATKMELTSGTSGGPVTVTKPSSYAIPSSVTAPLLAHTWKSSGFSQCSASCLGGISIDFSFLYTVGHCSFNGTLFLNSLYYRLSSLYNQYGNSATAATPAVDPGNLFDLSLVLVSL
jgi:hypothetical protein